MHPKPSMQVAVFLLAGIALSSTALPTQALEAKLPAALGIPDDPLLNPPDAPMPDSGIYWNARALQPGDVVAVGNPLDGGGCDFTGFGLTLTGTGASEGYVVDLRANDDCLLVVQESAGRLLQVQSEGTPEQPRPQSEPLLDPPLDSMGAGGGSGGGGSYYPSGQKTVSTYLWMYGYGGPDDRLTIKEGWLAYSYSRGIVWTEAQGGSCNTLESWWKIDGCWIDESGSSASRSWRKGSGDYHCGDPPSIWPCNMSSPDGYYHRLIDEENGYPDGTFRCNAWYSGQIVAGTLYYCSVY